jgi:radical SAM superfamily enzyme YgiQ (UPF0313 family)
MFDEYRVGVVYPAPYEVGMSNLGYHWVLRRTETIDGFTCERFFCEPGVAAPPRSLETGRPPQDVHLLLFSVSFELDFPAVLSFLIHAGLPPHSAERDARHPLVVAGGAALQVNPEPLAPFMDIILVGEGEDILPRFLEEYRAARDRRQLFQDLAGQPFVYIPSAMDVRVDEFGGITSRKWKGPEPAPDTSPVIRFPPLSPERLQHAAPPFNNILSPHTEFADTLLLEISRGCPMGCRYCWAGYRYLPQRAFPAEMILDIARQARQHTDRVGLVSTAVCQHPDIHYLLEELLKMRFSIGLSSLRLPDIDPHILGILADSGKESVTLAPETGSEALRCVINKPFTNEEILEKVRLVYSSGIRRLKLYFMTGLPDESPGHIDESLALIRDIMEIRAKAAPAGAHLTVSVSPFVPKPNTPFQFAPMASTATLKRNLRLYQRGLTRSAAVEIQVGSARDAALQYHVSMGSRRTGELLLAMAEGRLTPRGLLAENTPWTPGAGAGPPPWSVLDWGLSTDYLRQEWTASRNGRLTPPCPGGTACNRCGICPPGRLPAARSHPSGHQ